MNSLQFTEGQSENAESQTKDHSYLLHGTLRFTSSISLNALLHKLSEICSKTEGCDLKAEAELD